MTEVEKYIAKSFRLKLVSLITEFSKEIKATKRADLGLVGDVYLNTFFSFLSQMDKFMTKEQIDRDFEKYLFTLEQNIKVLFITLRAEKGIE